MKDSCCFLDCCAFSDLVSAVCVFLLWQGPGSDPRVCAACRPVLTGLRFVIWQSGQCCTQIGGSNQCQAGHCQKAGCCSGQIKLQRTNPCSPSPMWTILCICFIFILCLPVSVWYPRKQCNALDVLSNICMFYRPGWRTLTAVLRERRTSERY